MNWHFKIIIYHNNLNLCCLICQLSSSHPLFLSFFCSLGWGHDGLRFLKSIFHHANSESVRERPLPPHARQPSSNGTTDKFILTLRNQQKSLLSAATTTTSAMRTTRWTAHMFSTTILSYFWAVVDLLSCLQPIIPQQIFSTVETECIA